MKKTLFCVILGLLTVAVISCKKDDDDTTKPTLSGLVLESDHTTFMGEGTEIHVKANIDDLVSSDGKTFPETIGIYFVLNSGDRDTTTRDAKKSNPTKTFKLDEAGNYTVYCYAYGGSEFYNASASVSFVVVNPQTALSGLPELPTVEIGGKTFRTAEIGGKTWMANNLFGTESGSNYQNSPILSSLFGQYYTWTEAQTACPAGWHLPSAQEFDDCLGNIAGSLMVNAQFVDVDMWNYWPQVPITNASKFCAIPVGYRDFTLEKTPEDGYKQYACFWTSSCDDNNMGEFRYIYEQNNTVMKGKADINTFATSVRCVKNAD